MKSRERKHERSWRIFRAGDARKCAFSELKVHGGAKVALWLCVSVGLGAGPELLEATIWYLDIYHWVSYKLPFFQKVMTTKPPSRRFLHHRGITKQPLGLKPNCILCSRSALDEALALYNSELETPVGMLLKTSVQTGSGPALIRGKSTFAAEVLLYQVKNL